MNTPQPDDLLQITKDRYSECFVGEDYCDTSTYVVRYKHLLLALDDLIEVIYDEVDEPEEWPAFKPRPTAQAVHDELMADGKWESLDRDSGYDEYSAIYIQPFKVWEPAPQEREDTPRSTYTSARESAIDEQAAEYDDMYDEQGEEK